VSKGGYCGAVRPDQIALQLYTVRGLAATDLPGTLRAVADAGYQAVELAGLPDIGSTQLAKLLRDHGLRPVAAHQSIDSLRRDIDGVVRGMRELECPRAIVPWLPEADRRSSDDIRRVAAELSGFAQTLAKRGIRLGYHNHAFEFEPLDGTTVWDVLLAGLAPEVELEPWEGGAIETAGEPDPRTGVVERVDPNELLRIRWWPVEDESAATTVEFELGDGTPWGDEGTPAFAAAVESELERKLATSILREGAKLVRRRIARGETLVEQGTVVNLLVSLGPRPQSYLLPDLVGNDVQDVARGLREEGFLVEIREGGTKQKPGLVSAQEPAPGHSL